MDAQPVHHLAAYLVGESTKEHLREEPNLRGPGRIVDLANELAVAEGHGSYPGCELRPGHSFPGGHDLCKDDRGTEPS